MPVPSQTLTSFSIADSSVESIVSEIRQDEFVESTRSDAADLASKVAAIVSAVKNGGDISLLEFSRKFDGTSFENASNLFVTEEEFEEAEKSLSRENVNALKLALKQIRWLARKQKESRFGKRQFRTPLGYQVSERFVPLDRVGGYVPGGLASYPSTVLMICGPAREAGTKDIVLATPPGKDGRVNDGVLVAARLCGVREVIKLGGAQAIAALAYGTKSIKKVDLIAGPGNQYVTEAKRQVATSGRVSIDALAGPTELLILADKSANAEYVSEDLLSQAEHGNKTLCGLVSASESLLSRVRHNIEGSLDQERKRIESIKQSYLYLVRAKNLSESISFAQAFAPEHLEVVVKDWQRVSDRLSRSGLMLIGEYAPCSATDYIVGTDHILPTGGSASRTGGVSVETFLKRVESVRATPAALRKSLNALSTLALMEGLPNHARAAETRFKKRSVAE